MEYGLKQRVHEGRGVMHRIVTTVLDRPTVCYPFDEVLGQTLVVV